MFRSMSVEQPPPGSSASLSDVSDSDSDSEMRDVTFDPAAEKRRSSTGQRHHQAHYAHPVLPPPPPPPALVGLAAAKAALSPAAVLPILGREAEQREVTRFVERAVRDGVSPGALYVCGVPGTGKTAVISSVFRDVAERFSGGASSSSFRLVSLNALRLSSPQHMYSELWREMTTELLGPRRALAALEAMFTPPFGSGRRILMTVVLVDEIDVLITKDQGVLYNLFEWPVRSGSRLAVIGVANTHDLDERVLPRIASRLSSSKIAFSPYNVHSLRDILERRLQLAGCRACFSDDALSCVSRKVASISGDVRRALELLLRATEIRQQQSSGAVEGIVEIAHVVQAIRGVYASPHMQMMRVCSRLQKMVLAAVMLETRGTKNTTIQDVHGRLTTHLFLLCPLTPGTAQDTPLSPATVCRVVHSLRCMHLLVTGPHWQGIVATVAPTVHKDDVITVVKEDGTLDALLSQL